jgi:gluconokinase
MIEISGSAPVRAAPVVVVMGVSSSGKSSIAQALAARFGFHFVEGDDLHPAENVERMSHGLPLSDENRLGWLDTIAGIIAGADPCRGLVVTCSALKRSYRERLAAASPRVIFLHLAGSRDLIASRMALREGHFMPLSLLDSQFGDLEPPGPDENAVTLDIAREPGELLEQAGKLLHLTPASTVTA